MSQQLDTARRYLDACNRAEQAAVTAELGDPFTHYYLAPNKGSRPTEGRDRLAAKSARSVELAKSQWTIDHLIAVDDRIAVEYTMTWTPPDTGIATAMRATEFYDLNDGRIAEARSYHQVTATTSDLDGFPYDARGYGDGQRHAADPEVAGDVTQHRLALIRDYYDACTRADAETLQAMFTDDVVHYFLQPNVGSSPVAGGEHLARYWRKVAGMIQARWVVESIIERGTEAVIEWAMYWNPSPDAPRIVTRGAEWYHFEGDLISDIRSYHKQVDVSSELEGFPYADRGYSTIGSERSALHPHMVTSAG